MSLFETDDSPCLKWLSNEREDRKRTWRSQGQLQHDMDDSNEIYMKQGRHHHLSDWPEHPSASSFYHKMTKSAHEHRSRQKSNFDPDTESDEDDYPSRLNGDVDIFHLNGNNESRNIPSPALFQNGLLANGFSDSLMSSGEPQHGPPDMLVCSVSPRSLSPNIPSGIVASIPSINSPSVDQSSQLAVRPGARVPCSQTEVTWSLPYMVPMTVGEVADQHSSDGRVVDSQMVSTSGKLTGILPALINGTSNGGSQHDDSIALKSCGDRVSFADMLSNTQFTGSVSRQLCQQFVQLLKQLESAKDLNIELQDKLLCAEQELEAVRQTCCQERKVQHEDASLAVAGMVRHLCRDHAERERQLIDRLDAVISERDVLLSRIQMLGINQEYFGDETALSGMQTTDPADTKEKLPESALEACQRDLSVMEEKLRFLQRKQTLTEQERDICLAKVVELEQQLTDVHNRDSLSTASLKEVKLLHEQLMNIQMNSGQQVEKIDALHRERENLLLQVERLTLDKEQLTATVEKLTTDNEQLTDELSVSQTALTQTQDNADKLQRLVVVLRRKVNGLAAKLASRSTSDVLQEASGS